MSNICFRASEFQKFRCS